MIFLLLACTSTADLAPSDPGPFYDADPVIDSIDFSCDEEESSWTFVVRTTHWTGGGWIWMGKTIEDAEGHRITSEKAAADGSSDKLKLTLDIEPDWRDASRSKSTRWLCSDLGDLSFMNTVYNPTGSGVRDCRAWGDNPELWLEVEAAYDCETVMDVPVDTGR